MHSTSSTIVLVLAVFGASAVEMVEALTIVVAAGVSRGWRSALERMQVLKAQREAEDAAGSITPHPTPAATPDGAGEEYVTAADRLRATRPPEAP